MPKVKGQKSSTGMLSKKEAKAVKKMITGQTQLTYDSQPIGGCNFGNGHLVTSGRATFGGLLVAPGSQRVFVKTYSAFVTVAAGSLEFTTVIPSVIRHVLIWCNKAAVAPSVVSNPILNGSDVIGSPPQQLYRPILPVGERPNPFVVLSDTYHDLGAYIDLGPGLYSAPNPGSKTLKFDVPVNRWTSFEEAPTEAVLGGHYNSATAVGRISTGFLLSYWMTNDTGAAFYGNEYVTYQ